MKRVLEIVVAALAIIVFTRIALAFQSGAVQKWEYKVVTIDPSSEGTQSIQARLNREGGNGWELITAVGGVFNTIGLPARGEDPNRIRTVFQFVLRKPRQ